MRVDRLALLQPCREWILAYLIIIVHRLCA